jgi:hypothetical protein
MNTNVSNQISEIEEDDITIIRYKPAETIERPGIGSLRRIMKWFGFLSTIAWCAAALSPATFRVPVSSQGWFFIVAILWFFSFCAGLFNL